MHIWKDLSCDKTCKKFLTENEMPTKEIGQVLGLGGTCHCSCCPDGTGMYCFKCYYDNSNTIIWSNRIFIINTNCIVLKLLNDMNLK